MVYVLYLMISVIVQTYRTRRPRLWSSLHHTHHTFTQQSNRKHRTQLSNPNQPGAEDRKGVLQKRHAPLTKTVNTKLIVVRSLLNCQYSIRYKIKTEL